MRIYSKHYSQVEKIKSILKSSAKIQKREEKNYGNVIQSEIYFLHIGNQKIINELLGLGLTLKKNEDIKFPKITEKLIHHFIRGCWAGSGNVTTYNNGVFSSIIIGSIDFMTEIERILNLNGFAAPTNVNCTLTSYGLEEATSFGGLSLTSTCSAPV